MPRPLLLVIAAAALSVGCTSGSGAAGPQMTGDPTDGNRALGQTCDPTLDAGACAANLACCPPPGCDGDAGCLDNPLCEVLDGGGCTP